MDQLNIDTNNHLYRDCYSLRTCDNPMCLHLFVKLRNKTRKNNSCDN